MSSSPLPSPGWVSVQEIAAYFDVSIGLVYKLLDRGDLPHSKVGTLKRVKRQDFDAYVKAIEVGEKSKP